MAKKKKPEEDLGEDFTLYTTLMLPGGKLQHEHDEDCWCSPEILEDQDGNVMEILHQCPQ